MVNDVEIKNKHITMCAYLLGKIAGFTSLGFEEVDKDLSILRDKDTQLDTLREMLKHLISVGLELGCNPVDYDEELINEVGEEFYSRTVKELTNNILH